MAADAPTILATSGGWAFDPRTDLAYGPLLHHAIELSGATGRRPKVCHVDTASGDQRFFQAREDAAGRAAGVEVSHLNVFTMPNVEDPLAHLLDQDVVWVNGGSVANLLALWRLHGWDDFMRQAWEAGVVLAGVSAGSICWHQGGTTDSFGPELRPVTNGLGFLPYSNGVHHDSEETRRPLFQSLIAAGELPAGYATDDGVGILYRGTEFVEAVTEIPDKAAFYVEAAGDGTTLEHRIEPRSLVKP